MFVAPCVYVCVCVCVCVRARACVDVEKGSSNEHYDTAGA